MNNRNSKRKYETPVLVIEEFFISENIGNELSDVGFDELLQ